MIVPAPAVRSRKTESTTAWARTTPQRESRVLGDCATSGAAAGRRVRRIARNRRALRWAGIRETGSSTPEICPVRATGGTGAAAGDGSPTGGTGAAAGDGSPARTRGPAGGDSL